MYVVAIFLNSYVRILGEKMFYIYIYIYLASKR